MATPDYVIPNSLNYTDVKPVSTDSTIVMVKYQPQTAINGSKGGDMIKFILSGNGMLDPYSTHFQFTIECEPVAGEVRFLDRSAHSFIQRIVIRSQGVEIERIENYDVIAAMINDMIYSPEQAALHHWEGFPDNAYDFGAHPSEADLLHANGSIPREAFWTSMHQGGTTAIAHNMGEIGFHIAQNIPNAGANNVSDRYFLLDNRRAVELGAAAIVDQQYAPGNDPNNVAMPLSFAGHYQGRRVGATTANNQNQNLALRGLTKMQFCIPIYSGVIGLLMPEKKLLPLNLLPLDIEITLNPHALYSTGVADAEGSGSRAYKVTQFNLISNLLTFEQDIHRQLEASVSDHGLFIYCNSFHPAPQQLIAGRPVPSTSHIAVNMKSINSVHFLFMYNHFETLPQARKLHFVSHNIKQMFIVNGTQQLPQQPLEGNSGTSVDGSHLPFMIELYKAWNKLHDPTTDGNIHSFNWCGDEYACQFDTMSLTSTTFAQAASTMRSLVQRQSLVGRSQYALSLEGEELGSDKTMITGRKSQWPFYIQLASDGKYSEKTSYMLTFLRADFIIYIRPDLQIVTLGK